MKNKIDFIFSCIKKVFFETTMTTYTITERQESYVIGVVHTLIYLKKKNDVILKTVINFLTKNDECCYKGEFIRAIQELNDLHIIDEWYKFVDDENVEACNEDEADDYEVRNY